MAAEESVVLAFRVPKSLMSRIEKVCDRAKNPFAPSKARIGQRGVELALKELERAK